MDGTRGWQQDTQFNINRDIIEYIRNPSLDYSVQLISLSFASVFAKFRYSRINLTWSVMHSMLTRGILASIVIFSLFSNIYHL
jgi:hypothetical protein